MTESAEKVKTIPEVTAELAAPFPPEVVKWRPMDNPNSQGLCTAIAYVDTRAVQRRLNGALGLNGWKTRTKVLNDGSVVCRLFIRFPSRPDEWIYREDVGTMSDQKDNRDALKAAFSDSLKRAAVAFGVGEYLYRIGGVRHPVERNGNSFYLKGVPELPQWALPKEYRDCGVQYATKLFGLIETYAKDIGVSTDYIIADLFRKYGNYDPKATHLSRVEMRDAVRMLQDVHDRIEKRITGKASDASKPQAAPPKDDSGNQLPANGAELLLRIKRFDDEGVKQGYWKPGEPLKYIMNRGIAAKYPTSVDGWTAHQVAAAVGWIKDFQENNRRSRCDPKTQSGKGDGR